MGLRAANVYPGVRTQPLDRLIPYESLLKIELNQESSYKVTLMHINPGQPALPTWAPLRSRYEFVHPLRPPEGLKALC